MNRWVGITEFYIFNKINIMVNKELEIYSVVGCDLDYTSDDGDVCIYRLELRTLHCSVDETDDGVYCFKSDYGDELTPLQMVMALNVQ